VFRWVTNFGPEITKRTEKHLCRASVDWHVDETVLSRRQCSFEVGCSQRNLGGFDCRAPSIETLALFVLVFERVSGYFQRGCSILCATNDPVQMRPLVLLPRKNEV